MVALEGPYKSSIIDIYNTLAKVRDATMSHDKNIIELIKRLTKLEKETK